MNELFEVLRREAIYLWYYFELQFLQIFWYWVLGMAIGSLISVFAKGPIHGAFARLQGKKLGLVGIIPACILGIASPLCMYGIVSEAGNAGGLAGRIHDGLHPLKSSADRLQRRIRNYSPCRPHRYLFSVRMRCRSSHVCVLPGQGILLL